MLYGIGVGPGDPELMTLKAVRILKECRVLAIPGADKESCTAYQIAVQSVPEIEEKECLFLPMPMTKDKDILEESHSRACGQLVEWLAKGEDVALITLGDSTIYATCLYLTERMKKEGFPTVLINGIPSFCAAAARINVPLVSGADELHIIPASYDIDKAMELSGVKVFMKSGSQFKRVKDTLLERGVEAVMVEKCGMEGERIFTTADEMPDTAGYFTLLITRGSSRKE